MDISTQLEAENMIYSSYLRAIPNITQSLDLRVRKPELTRKLLHSVGDPDTDRKFILVTGSKGKGSTSRFISSLLSHLGYKVGLFTSPHLVDFRERIRIDGKAISERDFIRISNTVQPGFHRIEQDLAPDEYQGPIGVALAVAVLYFSENQTDINVIECGRGGLVDDTNVLQNDWAIITPIMEEHTNNLGPDLGNITRHKLGIIKKRTKYCYINKQSRHVSEQIKEVLGTKGGSYYGEQFVVNHVSTTKRGTHFDVETNRGTYPDLSIKLLGEFQAMNAAIAIKCCEDFIGREPDLPLVKECFANLQWPGRCEIVRHEPLTILDGAIHRDSARYVADMIKALYLDGEQQVTSIISVPKDKDYAGVIQVMSSVSKRLILTQPDVSHLVFPEDALEVANACQKESVEFRYLHDALAFVKENHPSDIVVIVGTQNLIGNAKRVFGQSLFDIGK